MEKLQSSNMGLQLTSSSVYPITKLDTKMFLFPTLEISTSYKFITEMSTDYENTDLAFYLGWWI